MKIAQERARKYFKYSSAETLFSATARDFRERSSEEDSI